MNPLKRLLTALALSVACLPLGDSASTIAQQPENPQASPAAPKKRAENEEARTRQRLTKRIAVDFVETPLAEALEFLGAAAEVQVYVNWKELEAAKISRDAPITLQLKNVRANMAMELALDQAGHDALTYAIRDNLLVVSSADDLDAGGVLRVYNCRDLLARSAAAEAASGSAMGDYGGASAMFGGMSGYGAGKVIETRNPLTPGQVTQKVLPPPPVSSQSAVRLVQIITTSVAPFSWQSQSASGGATIAEYDGLIAVKTSDRIHAQIEQVLNMLRQATAAGDQPAVIRTPPADQ